MHRGHRPHQDSLHLGVSVCLSMQQSEHGHTVRRAYIDLAVDDHRCLKVGSLSKTVALARGLAAVIELVREVSSIIGMQNGGIDVRDGPHDAVFRAVG